MNNPKLNQVAIRKAAKSEPYIYPDWFDIGKIAFSQTYNRHVKILGYLDSTVNIALDNNTAQVDLSDLSEPTIEIETNIDLTVIPRDDYRTLANDWLSDLNRVKILPGYEANNNDLPTSLHPALKQALINVGITQFYSHQQQAWSELNQGKSITIVTPTSSGKSLAFTPYAFQIALTQKKTTLLVYPLKALALDQYDKLTRLNQALPPEYRLNIVRCTGDVPLEERKSYFRGKTHPDIVLISPDVLHHNLWHTGNNKMQQWREFLARLGLVTIDESHSYISAFGIHFANVLRRLRLACQNAFHPTNQINWVIATATISNPIELATQFTGLPSKQITLIEESGAKTYAKTLLVLKPQTAPNFTVATIIRTLLGYNLSGLVFVNSRHTAKSLFSLINHIMGGVAYGVDIFHGSLPPTKRSDLINRLSDGRLKVLITTSALEAGLDLPALDWVILRGSTSLNSLWQRAGRAGRTSEGMVIFVPDGSNYIDYYYATEPERLFAPVEKIKIQPNYPPILARHLTCAGAEGGIPVYQIESFFGNTAPSIASELVKQKQLYWTKNQTLTKKGYPHGEISLRGIVNETISLVDKDTGEVLEEMALNFAFRECHPQAIYLTSAEGESVNWRCLELNLDNKKAIVKKIKDLDRQTRPIVELNVSTSEQLESPQVIKGKNGNARLSFWWGTISEKVLGYHEEQLIYAPVCTNRSCTVFHLPQPKKHKCQRCHRKLVDRLTIKELGEVMFENPLVTSFEAPILRIEINLPLAQSIFDYAAQLKEELIKEWGCQEDIPEQLATVFAVNPIHTALHSLTHVLIKSVPLLFLASDKYLSSLVETRKDNKKESAGNSHPIVAYIYDNTNEGNGTSESLFTDWDNCWQKAKDIATGCDCDKLGCPKCLTMHGCPEHNEALNKPLGLWLLDNLGANID